MTSFADIPGISTLDPWATQAELNRILTPTDNKNIHLAQLDASRMKTLDDLFYGFSGISSFPEYFGWNWAAFADCIRDLAWLLIKRLSAMVASAEPLTNHE
ncbi:barstar family protein [Paenarthrobacter sp. NPDC089675]|uniref:barstar family protein n=1 Tax=Paenarthrobacter sp. NPDC089675 TaxID=3364376 RepID=UPI003822F5B1